MWCSSIQLKVEDSYTVAPSFRKFLVRFSVKFFQSMPEDILKFGLDYFQDLKNKQNLQLAIEGKESPYVLKTRRDAVSNEPINIEQEIPFEKHEKSNDEIIKLMRSMSKIILFQHLGRNDIEKLITAMVPKTIKKGRCVIIQGEEGDYFFIIDSGEFEVYAKNKQGFNELVKTYKNEGSFGEIALLYNLPRSATVKCTKDGKLWTLDRNIFRRVVAKNVRNRRKRYSELIASVPILQDLTPQEIIDLADVMQTKTFNKNDCIIRQNDYPDGMYFIEFGTVNVVRVNENKQIEEICKLKRGDYFGELALIDNQRRAASVFAESFQVSTVFLETEAFERLLGRCIDIMKRNKENYEKRLKELEQTALSK